MLVVTTRPSIWKKSLALLSSEPLVPRVPQLLRQDDTPEATAKSLAFEYPTVGIITAEAGIVFGGHAMNDDNVMKAMGRLNILWDGGSLSIGRVTSESFVVRGARITLGLMIQEEPLRKFPQRTGVFPGALPDLSATIHYGHPHVPRATRDAKSCAIKREDIAAAQDTIGI
jgi:hypothetical protein